jgi:thiol-disulfide isomerase/thioredoxin
MINKNLWIGYAIILAVFGILLGLSNKKGKSKFRKSKNELIQQQPQLHYKLIKRGKSDIKDTYIINFFDPSCEACRNMTQKIANSKTEFNKVHFMMLSLGTPFETIQFMKDFKLDSASFVTLGCDTAHMAMNVFKVGSVPTYFVYNSDKLLIDLINGKTTLDRLLKHINEKK